MEFVSHCRDVFRAELCDISEAYPYHNAKGFQKR